MRVGVGQVELGTSFLSVLVFFFVVLIICFVGRGFSIDVCLYDT